MRNTSTSNPFFIVNVHQGHLDADANQQALKDVSEFLTSKKIPFKAVKNFKGKEFTGHSVILDISDLATAQSIAATHNQRTLTSIDAFGIGTALALDKTLCDTPLGKLVPTYRAALKPGESYLSTSLGCLYRWV